MKNAFFFFEKQKYALAILTTMAFTPVHAQSSFVQSLAGQWQFTASNNGKEIAPGIYSAGKDTISFTAAVGDDGKSLNCHADCMYKSVTNNEYPADWKVIVEENDQGLYRLGWVLTKDQPAFSKEFLESKESYLENGFWYWGTDAASTHRYIYLLTENEDASAHVATTFWSAWNNKGCKEYSLTSTEYNSQKFYAIVAAGIPYGNSTGYIEIWSSPKVKQISSAGIHSISYAEDQTSVLYYDLSGRRLHAQPQRGLYINNGKKVVLR